ncbi:MAG: hypothetical protein ACM3XM_03020 [Mycobacterium leprae]
MIGDRICIALVGAGLTGTPLLQSLLAQPFVQVCLVVDLMDDAPGMILARTHNIRTAIDPTAVLELKEPVDLVLNLSGDRQVEADLRSALEQVGNQQTAIMPEVGAALMLSMVRGQLVRPAHG